VRSPLEDALRKKAEREVIQLRALLKRERELKARPRPRQGIASGLRSIPRLPSGGSVHHGPRRPGGGVGAGAGDHRPPEGRRRRRAAPAARRLPGDGTGVGVRW